MGCRSFTFAALRCFRGRSYPALLLLLLLSSCGRRNAPDEHAQTDLSLHGPFLTISLDDQAVVLSLAEMMERFASHTMTVDDPTYRESKTYEGILLSDLLEVVNAAMQGDHLVFRCLDGYSPRMPMAAVREARPVGLVAFRDTEADHEWEPLPGSSGKIATPGPFYLVWGALPPSENPEPSPDRPWPYQLVEIEMTDLASRFDRVYPAQVPEDSAIRSGFDLFAQKCLQCHSLNLQGGSLGPELNVPRNVTEYREGSILRAFIRDASGFQAFSKMPSFEELSEDDIDDILSYLHWMRDHKWMDYQQPPTKR